MVLSSEESELGTAREELACDYQGPDTTIALNYKYVEDPLKVMQGATVYLEFTESNRAITLSPEEESGFFHIVMPMQLE